MTEVVRAAGFLYVTLDTQGYRSGSMNDVLPVYGDCVRRGRRGEDPWLVSGHLRSVSST